MKIILDTSTLVSAIFFSGKPSQILSKIINGEITLIVTDDIFEEYKEVLSEERFYQSSDLKKKDVLKFLKYLIKIAENVTPSKAYEAIKDDISDNKFLDAAVEGEAKIIVTSDKKHILKLKKFKGIPILSPAKFLKKLGLLTKEEKRRKRYLLNIKKSMKKRFKTYVIEPKSSKKLSSMEILYQSILLRKRIQKLKKRRCKKIINEILYN